MKEIPKVSVIVPVYRGIEYIGELLSCLRAQTLHSMEFIFIDDKGGDGTFEIVKEAAKYDSRIVCLDNVVNRGPGYSRNRGVELARGEYVAFADADDFVGPDFYELLYKRAIKEKVLVVKGHAQSVYPDGVTKLSCLNEVIESGLQKKVDLMNLFTYEHWSAIYNREYVQETGAFYHENSKYGEDTYFLMCLMYYVSSADFALENKAVYSYRQNESSLMNVKKDAGYLQQIRCRAEVRFDWLDSKNDSEKILKYVTKVFEDQLGWLLNEIIDDVDDLLLEDYLLYFYDKLKMRIAAGNGFKPGVYANALLASAGRLERFRIYRAVWPILQSLRNEVDGRQNRIVLLQNRIEELQQDIVALQRVSNIGLIASELCRRYRLLAIRKFFSFGDRRERYQRQQDILNRLIREYKMKRKLLCIEALSESSR